MDWRGAESKQSVRLLVGSPNQYEVIEVDDWGT